QRRHQKVVEEAPCAALTAAERDAICESGRRFAAEIGYVGAGTVEFLFDPLRREHYFLEMNTRLQVEHPVTECVAGVDLVLTQLRVACGLRLVQQSAFDNGLSLHGHAIEVRVYAEDPATGYLPQVGILARVRWPRAPFVRVDVGYDQGDEVTMHYDPMLGKIIAWGADRQEAIDRLVAALRDTVIHGVVTNIPMLIEVLERPEVRAAEVDTGSLGQWYGDRGPGLEHSSDSELKISLAVAGHGGPMTSTRTDSDASYAASSDPWGTLGAWRSGEGGGPR
ncbi:MAG TPA: 3-methylcrotonyl-CoA carboxylase, partial [Myxococcales bacterium]|nr:3-methylcrotonyl-CoA carboxylase [Myxococcales bacterium]